MNKSLIDTDIFSEIIKGVDPTVAAHARTYRRAFGRYTITAVTVMEIVQGYQRKQATRQLQAFLTALPSQEVLPFEEADGELAGRIAGELERTGRPIGTADSMIAALAIGHGLELVTGNTAHFQRVQQLGYPLTLVNWR
ncbi:MAG: PIN domain-containing protein, partial [Isosphaeraceae bacterium]